MHGLTSLSKRRKVILGLLTLVILAGVGFAAYYFFKPQSEKPIDPEQARIEEFNKKRNEEIAKVEKHINLPDGEEPIMATVSDKGALQGQAFFKNAQNGDRVLMYPKAKKAYLYRPSEDRVIAEAPLDFQENGNGMATTSATASPSARPTPNLQ